MESKSDELNHTVIRPTSNPGTRDDASTEYVVIDLQPQEPTQPLWEPLPSPFHHGATSVSCDLNPGATDDQINLALTALYDAMMFCYPQHLPRLTDFNARLLRIERLLGRCIGSGHSLDRVEACCEVWNSTQYFRLSRRVWRLRALTGNTGLSLQSFASAVGNLGFLAVCCDYVIDKVEKHLHISPSTLPLNFKNIETRVMVCESYLEQPKVFVYDPSIASIISNLEEDAKDLSECFGLEKSPDDLPSNDSELQLFIGEMCFLVGYTEPAVLGWEISGAIIQQIRNLRSKKKTLKVVDAEENKMTGDDYAPEAFEALRL